MQEPDPSEVVGRSDAESVELILDALGDFLELLAPHMQACAGNIGLAAPYAMALRRIDGATPMKDLAQRLHCDPSFVTAIADVLEERGYATRRNDVDDRRVKNLVLTPAGIEAEARFRRDLATLPPGLRALAPAEQQELLRLLSSIVERESGARLS